MGCSACKGRTKGEWKNEMSYTIREEGRGEYTEKKSVFIGRLKRVTSEEEAREYIAEIRKLEKGARHHVFAYIIGADSGIVRYSDDGEPQGTGGQPVLRVLGALGLTDVCLVVTRFFGGVLLGAAGLTRAYSKAASDAAASVKRWETAEGALMQVRLAYDVHARLKTFLDTVQILATSYEDAVTLDLIVPREQLEELQKDFLEQSQGKAAFSEAKVVPCFLREDGFLEEITH